MRKIQFLLGCIAFCTICNLAFGMEPTALKTNRENLHLVQTLGTIRGRVITETGEPSAYCQIRILDTEMGTYSNEDGEFALTAIPAGEYTIKFSQLGYEDVFISDVVVKENKVTLLHSKVIQQEKTLKPIIYLYPENETQVTVKLDYQGKLTTTYPKINGDSWTITADNQGQIVDADNRTYYALYWEGVPDVPLTISAGEVVSKDETITFLEDSLDLLGLTEREANEFIIFWLPILEENPWNIISFSTDEYSKQAPLEITPQPETLIRVMMVYHGLKKPIEFPKQNLSALQKTRQGFTVVEWGGQKANTLLLGVRN